MSLQRDRKAIFDILISINLGSPIHPILPRQEHSQSKIFSEVQEMNKKLRLREFLKLPKT